MTINGKEVFFLSRQGRCLKALEEGFPNMPESERVACAVQYSRRKSNPFDILVRHKRLVENTVVAYIRHRYTDYDSLLDQGVQRPVARERVSEVVRRIFEHWKGGGVIMSEIITNTERADRALEALEAYVRMLGEGGSAEEEEGPCR